MLLLNDGSFLDIDDDRVKTFPCGERVSSDLEYYDILVDGELFMRALRVYMEHKQYVLFQSMIKSNPNIKDMWNDECNVVFIDMGFSDKQLDSVNDLASSDMVFKDYTEKVRDGISYFSDIITESEKNGSFKNNYVRVEVLL